MNKRKIKLTVDALRKRYNLILPVDLDKLAEAIGVEIKYGNFKGELSGFAYQKSNSKFIGVNMSEKPTRRRFTIAHELGHLFLHKEDSVNYDTKIALVLFRDNHSSDGTDIKEVEANAFAAELLMPEDSIRAEISKLGGIDLEDDGALMELASKYKVSRQAIIVRLTSLYT
jgi:Zn-dependent peptidase ImmA (M78 family)